MPGLFGYTDNNGQSGDDRILLGMRDLLLYANADTAKSEPFYHAGGVHAGYCAPAFEAVDGRTAEADGVACWFDGEIYNFEELAKDLPPVSARPQYARVKELIISAYKSDCLNDLLKKVDGYFSAVIHDAKKQRIILITDRFGFRLLSCALSGKNIMWASECKAFLAVPGFSISADRRSVDEFIRYGALCGERTWLCGVSVIDQATVLTFDIGSGSVKKERYWLPDDIRPFTGKLDIGEYCDEWGRLFGRAVAKRVLAAERAGITLSGGLDSRAILAAMPQDGCGINAVTLGPKGCDDVRFAAMAAKIKGASHQYFPLLAEGWFDRACLGVWATDGALNVSSQLGIEHLAAFSKLFDVNMTGMGGGVMQGGMEPGAAVYDIYGAEGDGLMGLHMRNRRMIRAGFRLDESFFKVRIPYYDNDLYSFVMAVPQDIRKKGFLINMALLRNFPEYYKRIPWQKTGVPISWPPVLFTAGTFYNRAKSRLKRKLRGLGLPVSDTKLYFNLSETLRVGENMARAEAMLADKSAFHREYVSDGVSASSIHKHANLKLDRMCRVLTFEIWMRQLHDSDFRARSLLAL